MEYSRIKGVVVLFMIALLFFTSACKKELSVDSAKVKPPIRTYIITARADKKGTNSNSVGKAVLSGQYDEETKVLDYSIEYTEIVPMLMTLRYGAKGSAGTFVRELYNAQTSKQATIRGSFALTPLEERNLLKGLWFVSVSTATMAAEISGVLTYKQK